MLGSPSARAPRPLSLCSRAQEPQLPKPACPRARAQQQERPPQRETHALQLRNLHGSEGPAQPKWADATKFTYIYIISYIYTHTGMRRAWQPTPVFLPGESHGQRAWWATVSGVTKSQTRVSGQAYSTHVYIYDTSVEKTVDFNACAFFFFLIFLFI